ncbi:MAG: SDR family NAD(P)-dependent oxidoreductase, partial [Bacilli bacterium]
MRRHVFITAGTKGLGKKVVEFLLNRGYVVSATYRSDFRWDEAFLKQYSEQLLVVQADVTNVTQMQNAICEAKEVFGSIDILINNAGPYIFERKRILDYTEEEWHTVMHGNLLNQLKILKEIVPDMRANNFGRIVNYGYSQVDHTPAWPMRGAFAAAKAGLASLTRTLAHEEAEFGITV